jgi:hypothetical protein
VRSSPSIPFALMSTKPEPPDPHAALTGPDHRPSARCARSSGPGRCAVNPAGSVSAANTARMIRRRGWIPPYRANPAAPPRSGGSGEAVLQGHGLAGLRLT